MSGDKEGAQISTAEGDVGCSRLFALEAAAIAHLEGLKGQTLVTVPPLGSQKTPRRWHWRVLNAGEETGCSSSPHTFLASVLLISFLAPSQSLLDPPKLKNSQSHPPPG